MHCDDNQEALPVYEAVTITSAKSMLGPKAQVFISSGYGYRQDNRKPPPVIIIVLIMPQHLVINCFFRSDG